VNATRKVVLGVLVVATAAALAGCSLLLPTSRPSQAASSAAATKADAGEPAVGQCWNANIKDAGAWADWNGHAATSCAKSHTLYTYGVGHVSGLQPTDWAVSSSNPALRDDVAAAASATCTAPQTKFLPTMGDPAGSLLRTYFFVPSRAQWDKGARWVRCDIAQIDFGTSTASERFTPLPLSIVTLVEGIATDPAAYALCVNTGHSTATGPFADKTDVITDCRDNPEWIYATTGDFTQASTSPYPTKAVISARVRAVCESVLTGANQVWSGSYPSAATWKTGDRTIECWAGLKNWAPGSGTGSNA
jgi:hypothetical protein